MTHTPGPWFFDKRTLSIGFAGGWIASIDDQYREGEGLGVIFDDAHLIAAAPELLEALKSLADTPAHDTKAIAEAWDKAYKAIAKAEGKT